MVIFSVVAKRHASSTWSPWATLSTYALVAESCAEVGSDTFIILLFPILTGWDPDIIKLVDVISPLFTVPAKTTFAPVNVAAVVVPDLRIIFPELFVNEP